MLASSIAALLSLAGQSCAWQIGAIILGTFILEDAATVLAATEAAAGAVPIWVALGSLYAGIVFGDLGLYGLGSLSSKIRLLRRVLPPRRQDAVRAWLRGRVFRVVFVSRFLPGLRLPTYTTCGFLGADLRQFILAAVIATTIWTSLLFVVSLWFGRFLLDHLGAWRWAGAIGFAVFVIIAGRLAASGVRSVQR
jgi:membrane protein DedA with SNARE-associated domain